MRNTAAGRHNTWTTSAETTLDELQLQTQPVVNYSYMHNMLWTELQVGTTRDELQLQSQQVKNTASNTTYDEQLLCSKPWLCLLLQRDIAWGLCWLNIIKSTRLDYIVCSIENSVLLYRDGMKYADLSLSMKQQTEQHFVASLDSRKLYQYTTSLKIAKLAYKIFGPTCIQFNSFNVTLLYVISTLAFLPTMRCLSFNM